jgi:PhnB protein
MRLRQERFQMTTPHPDRQSVTAHLIARDAASAIAFYTRALGARELYRLVEPGGKVGHAELMVGTSRIMICDEYPDFGALSAPTIGGSPIKLLIYVDDADAVMRQAIAAGATELRAVKNQFHGDRSGMILDPFGFIWSIATPIEDVSPDEMQRRFTEALAT